MMSAMIAEVIKLNLIPILKTILSKSKMKTKNTNDSRTPKLKSRLPSPIASIIDLLVSILHLHGGCRAPAV